MVRGISCDFGVLQRTDYVQWLSERTEVGKIDVTFYAQKGNRMKTCPGRVHFRDMLAGHDVTTQSSIRYYLRSNSVGEEKIMTERRG